MGNSTIKADVSTFQGLILEGAQAGLSWLTVLRKRENYRKVFEGFDPSKVARFNRRKIESCLKNPGIIRNRLKIESTVKNAQAFLEIKDKSGSFTDFIWQFVDGRPLTNAWQTLESIPGETDQSRLMSKTLKKHGFSFVGPTICYAFMQAVGMVNDHVVDCFRHEACKKLYP